MTILKNFIRFIAVMIFQGLLLFAVSVTAASIGTTATIIADELNMRSGPGFHNPPLAVLQKGSNVRVLSYEGEWIKIKHKGKTGFIFNRNTFVKIKTPPVNDPEDNRENIHKQTDIIQKKIETGRANVKKITEKEKDIINYLNETDKSIDRARKKAALIKAELLDLKKKTKKTEKSFDDMEQRVIHQEQYAYQRLAALYKLNRIGGFQILVSADSSYDFYFRKKMMETILDNDERIMDRLRSDQETLEKLLAQLKWNKAAKETNQILLEKQLARMNSEKAKKEAILKEIRDKKSLQLAAIESMKQHALALDKTVHSFNKTRQKPVTDQKEFGETPFSELKGLLMMPVKGRIVSFFGQYKNKKLNVMNFQSGIHIKADRGEPIRAVSDGSALYASWFKGYGNMLIIDHGEHYYTVYAHLEEVFKKKGDRVETGEVIATVGDTGSITGSGLHFEVRHHGKPMNPLKWIKKT